MFNTILTIICTVLIFGIIITIHEFGHFIVAKLSKITVHEFSIGMGPKLFSKQKNETLYCLRALPIGGYVKMEGEDEVSNDSGSFSQKNVFVRICVVAAGAILNLLLGLIILLFININKTSLPSNTVSMFNEEATSVKSGLKLNDTITSINGRRIFIANDIIFEMVRDRDGLIDIGVIRDGKHQLLKNVEFKKSVIEKNQETIDVDFKVKAEKNNIFNTIIYSLKETVSISKMVFSSLFDLLTGRVPINQVSGPIGVASVVQKAISVSFESLLSIASILTINIGLFNLLPIPALDGGRLVFLFIEAIRGKPIKPEHESYVHSIGFLLLIGLIILVTFQDIFKLFVR